MSECSHPEPLLGLLRNLIVASSPAISFSTLMVFDVPEVFTVNTPFIVWLFCAIDCTYSIHRIVTSKVFPYFIALFVFWPCRRSVLKIDGLYCRAEALNVRMARLDFIDSLDPKPFRTRRPAMGKQHRETDQCASTAAAKCSSTSHPRTLSAAIRISNGDICKGMMHRT